MGVYFPSRASCSALLTLAFLQHIYARLSPNSAGHGQSQTSQDAPARPDLNSIASLVLSYLPFAPQTPNAANAALRSSLLTAVTRVEQGSVLQDTCPPLLFVCDPANSTTFHSRSDQPAGPRPRLSPAADGRPAPRQPPLPRRPCRQRPSGTCVLRSSLVTGPARAGRVALTLACESHRWWPAPFSLDEDDALDSDGGNGGALGRRPTSGASIGRRPSQPRPASSLSLTNIPRVPLPRS
jgi:hypothetical protein